MTMYDPKADERTFDDHKGRQAVFPAMTEADHALAYAKEAFKRLTGYPAKERHIRGTNTGAAGAMAYADDTFARMKGYRMNHPYDFDYHLHRHRARDDHVARGGGMPSTQAEWSMIYAKDVFRRLRGLPAQGPLGLNGRQDEARQRRCQRPSRSGGRLRNSISTARTVSSSVNGSLPIANAIRRAMVCLAILIRAAVLEPYAQRRRRRIAIAQLKALDDRLLADIGLSRNDIERVVDDMLARRGDTSSRPATRSLPTEDHQHDLPLAA
jgi:uncharacterized protein YjiS (DUF1127 family)